MLNNKLCPFTQKGINNCNNDDDDDDDDDDDENDIKLVTAACIIPEDQNSSTKSLKLSTRLRVASEPNS